VRGDFAPLPKGATRLVTIASEIMKTDDNLYKLFLEHMHDLENFRMSYAALHPATPLDREDPDVRRLTEAMTLQPAHIWRGFATLWISVEESFNNFFHTCSRPCRPWG